MTLHVGIDIGSKTIKAVVLEGGADGGAAASPSPTEGAAGQPLLTRCADHRGRIRPALEGLLAELAEHCGSQPALLTLTGSGATGLADASGTPFLQEVAATRRAVTALHPGADAFVELGGEDAKLVYLAPPVEHRMNTSCAGGTGSFLEDVAALLNVPLAELDRLAAAGEPRYAIASRCAVFATRDLKPLAAGGKSPADIAASAYQAVVDQVLGTLACGRPLRGTVLFLGGPMEHLPALVERFRLSLGLQPGQAVKPPNAQLMAAWGCALASVAAHAQRPAQPLGEHSARLLAAFERSTRWPARSTAPRARRLSGCTSSPAATAS
ncbi:MAG: BadF/BadG/BcrA/BcrD ATPase family protein [Coriobacteriales bacterium]